MSHMSETQEESRPTPQGPQMGVLGHSEAPHQTPKPSSATVQADSPHSPTPPPRDALDHPRGAEEAEEEEAQPELPVQPRRAAVELASTLASVPHIERQPWWRRWLRLGPKEQGTQEELSRRAILRTVFADPLVVAVVSPKGQAGKTSSARALAAALASQRGGGVVVVCVNELRGTLGQRSVLTHEGHIGNLIEHADYLLSNEARVSEVERCMNRQPDSFEWVLTSDRTTTKPITEAEFDKILAILKRFFSIIIFDTSNSELASSWRSANAAADVALVPMKWRGDSMVPATEMLDAMRDRGQAVTGRTILLGTNGPNDVDSFEKSEGFQVFEEHYPEVAILEIPVDPGLHRGIIRWTDLKPSTRTAFEKVGAELIQLALGERHV